MPLKARVDSSDERGRPSRHQCRLRIHQPGPGFCQHYAGALGCILILHLLFQKSDKSSELKNNLEETFKWHLVDGSKRNE